MRSKFLIPTGFKDHVSFDAYIEHEYKNNIIEFFRLNGFDLVKTPLIDFLENLNELRKEKPEDHNKYSKKILEYNKKSYFKLQEFTNV